MTDKLDHAPARRESREPIGLFVEYEGADDFVVDFTDNLSTGGTFIATRRELAIGERVKLGLSFPGLLESIVMAGTVRWVRAASGSDDAGAGIEFDEGPERAKLAQVIERVRQRNPRTVARPVKLLVVDDNPHVAELIQQGLHGSSRRDLTGLAFAFASASDGRAAVEILRRESFDAMIIDVYLPVLDGPKVISQARNELDLADLPIIAFSAGGPAARDAALGAGANTFLDKPMRLRQVLETLQRLLPAQHA